MLVFIPAYLFSLGEEGALLRPRLVTASRPIYEASPSFASCYALATAEGRPSPKPSLTHCTFKGCDSAYAPHVFKFTFLRCGSRWVKFKVEIYKFDFKFRHKAIRRSIFSLDKAEFKF